MTLAVLGPQGSGKGTQAEILAEKYGWVHIETGKILRELVTTGNPLADKIRTQMNQGLLVSDEILTEVLGNWITKDGVNKGIVFDGTPRNLAQYFLIKKILEELGGKLDRVIFLKISNEESLKRMSSRRTCNKCGEVFNLLTNPPNTEGKCDLCGGELIHREDDQPEIIAKRLKKFTEATTPVIEQARKEGILVEIDGEKPIVTIFKDIVGKLEL